MAKEDVKNLEKALDDDERIELFFSKHWKKVLGAAVVILLAGVVAYSIYYTNKKNTEKATLELASAKAENLPALLEKHSDVPGAAFARLRLAHYQFGKKQYEEAAGNFAAEYPEDTPSFLAGSETKTQGMNGGDPIVDML